MLQLTAPPGVAGGTATSFRTDGGEVVSVASESLLAAPGVPSPGRTVPPFAHVGSGVPFSSHVPFTVPVMVTWFDSESAETTGGPG